MGIDNINKTIMKKTKTVMNNKIVMVFGTFDLLHPGHLNFFRQAKEHGKKLIAIIARDETVKTIKGNYPEEDEQTRLQNVKSANDIDLASLGNRNGNKFNIIKDHMPDIICLGYDQEVDIISLKKFLASESIKIIRLKPFKPDIHKSSKLKQRNRKKNKRKGD